MSATWRVLTEVTMAAPPASRLDDRLPSQAAGRARLTAVRALPGVTKASLHLCPHAAGEPATDWYNCRDDAQAQYEEL